MTLASRQRGSETLYGADSNGNFTTTCQGHPLTLSFLDSGSNGLFFDDNSIRPCTLSVGFYCPMATSNLSATNASFNGARSGTLNFTVENVDGLGPAIVAASIGGSYSGASSVTTNGSFDWGLPFFFGRRVFVALEGSASAGGPDPYWAY